MVRRRSTDSAVTPLVALRQSRDKETGWFIFNWRLQPDRLEGFTARAKEVTLKARGQAITTAVDAGEMTRLRFMKDLGIGKIVIGNK